MSRLLLRVVMVAVLLTGLLLLVLPPERDDDARRALLPWAVAPDGQGGSTAFGLALGQSSLADAEQILGEAALTLFRQPDGRFALEAFLASVCQQGKRAEAMRECQGKLSFGR